MKTYQQPHDTCVNTSLINTYLNEQDERDKAFDYVYEKVTYEQRPEIENAECIENIHDDLMFEINYIIDRDSWDVEAEEVAKKIYSDFYIKGSK